MITRTEKQKKIKQIAAVFFYGISAIKFGLFVFYMVHPRYRFDISSTLFFSLIVCGALVIGTCFLTNATSDFAKKRKIIRKTIIVLFAVYVLCLIDLLFFQNRFISEFRFNLDNLELRANFIPFHTIMTYLNAGGRLSINIIITNILGNLLAFAPMGFFLPILFDKMKKFIFYFITILVMLLAVETIQLVFRVGVFDVDDIILNSIGAILVWCVCKSSWCKRLFY